ncbi:AT-rich interactive domain-containing protein [Drosera capensis]
MLLAQGDSRQNCNVLAVVCEDEKRHGEEDDQQSKYPFPKTVHTLTSPSIDEFQKMNESFRPNVVYMQGESFQVDEVGSLTWEGLDISTIGRVAEIFGSRLPTVVVSRGGFHVGNGINWKGQVFSKMRNYTASNRMTGVGNTGAAGDWVNCGTCGGWAHFGCDRRQGLGAFKITALPS